MLLLAVTAVVAAGCRERPGAVADPQAPTAGRNAERWVEAPYVILVSLDGFAAGYVQRYRPPTLLSLVSDGVWASRGMTPAYPTETFPNHYTMATGLYPAHHGIVANTFYDPERRETYRISDPANVGDGTWYGGEPLWVTAERQGMVAATYYWVGSEADVGGVRPSHWRVHDPRVPNRERVDQVLEWLAYPAGARPHLITLYFGDTDGAGHAAGPDSPDVERAVARVDAQLARLLHGLDALPIRDLVTVIVVSDHGMDGYTPATTEYVADAVRDMAGIRMTEVGAHSNLWVEGGPARVRAVRDAIDAGLPHVRAYLADRTPQRLHYRGNRRLGDIVLMPDSGWVVYPENDRPSRAGFTHGWDSAFESMTALFVARGPRINRGLEIAPFPNVDIYPLVTELLGLRPAPGIDGRLERWRSVLRP